VINESDLLYEEQDDPRISILLEIKIEWSDEHESAFDSIRVKCEFDSNKMNWSSKSIMTTKEAISAAVWLTVVLICGGKLWRSTSGCQGWFTSGESAQLISVVSDSTKRYFRHSYLHWSFSDSNFVLSELHRRSALQFPFLSVSHSRIACFPSPIADVRCRPNPARMPARQ
jgi:hypothetical protein